MTRTLSRDARSDPSPGLRIVATTFQPRSANNRAVDLPIPELAPVMRMVCDMVPPPDVFASMCQMEY